MSQVEVWKDIPGFEGYYQASILGRIRSLYRYTNYKNTGMALRKGKVLSPKVTNRGLEVTLTVNGRSYYKRVHQLVASTFIPNPKGLYCISHINGNKQENRICNLEWYSPLQSPESYYPQRVTYEILAKEPPLDSDESPEPVYNLFKNDSVQGVKVASCNPSGIMRKQ